MLSRADQAIEADAPRYNALFAGMARGEIVAQRELAREWLRLAPSHDDVGSALVEACLLARFAAINGNADDILFYATACDAAAEECQGTGKPEHAQVYLDAASDARALAATESAS